ncbi:MAG: hypothetical protein WAN43_01295 [Rhodomicrobium sp.]|jgi:hypothetical protein
MGMFRSLVGIFFILLSIPLITSGFLSIPSYVGFPSKIYDVAAGVALFTLGLVIGKLWIINYHKKIGS